MKTRFARMQMGVNANSRSFLLSRALLRQRVRVPASLTFILRSHAKLHNIVVKCIYTSANARVTAHLGRRLADYALKQGP